MYVGTAVRNVSRILVRIRRDKALLKLRVAKMVGVMLPALKKIWLPRILYS
jgi:hypothetical protein